MRRGVADGQPSSGDPRRNRDHRPDNALTTAAANPAGIGAGMLELPPLRNLCKSQLQ